MFNTLWAVGCQTFRVEKEQKCFTGFAVMNQQGLGSFVHPNAAWFLLKKTKCRLPGPLSPLREENQPCSCPSPLPTAPSLDLGWSKTIVADLHTPQQIPAVKHLGKCCFFSKKKSASGLAYDSQPPGFTSQMLPRTVKGPSTHLNWAVTGAAVFVGW